MIRGTTPTHIFQLPFNPSTLKEVKITYAQNEEIVLEKNTDDCQMEDDKITVKLTQEDTLKFSHNTIAEIQLKVQTVDGNVLATSVIRLGVGEILSEEVFP